jgi:hypothetical protein
MFYFDRAAANSLSIEYSPRLCLVGAISIIFHLLRLLPLLLLVLLANIYSTCSAILLSHSMMVECDVPNDLPAALSPIPSVRTFMAIVTISTGVLSLAITVPVRSLNCLPQTPHRYFWIWLPPFNLVLPFLATCSLWHFGHFIYDY